MSDITHYINEQAKKALRTIWIAPHERFEAIEAYRDLLTATEIQRIINAPRDQWLVLTLPDKVQK